MTLTIIVAAGFYLLGVLSVCMVLALLERDVRAGYIEVTKR
jgi:hypothetical protein